MRRSLSTITWKFRKLAGMKSNFEKLRVYRLSEKVADQVWNLVADWDWFEKRTLGLQLVRAADSVGANIAEGEGRGSYVDNKRFVRMARGSLNETKHFLRGAYRRQLLKASEVETLKPLLDELGPTLNKYRKSIGNTRTLSALSANEPTAH
jgi:four helix bundle protein